MGAVILMVTMGLSVALFAGVAVETTNGDERGITTPVDTNEGYSGDAGASVGATASSATLDTHREAPCGTGAMVRAKYGRQSSDTFELA